MDNKIISNYQLAIALFLSRIVGVLINLPTYTGKTPVLEIVVNELLCATIGFALLLPSVYLGNLSKKQTVSIIDRIISLAYVVVLVGLLAVSFYDFYNFFAGNIFQTESVVFFVLTVFIVVVFATKSGLEAVMRTSTVVLVMFLISFCFITISSIKSIDISDFSFLGEKFNSLSVMKRYNLTEYILFAVLSQKAKGNKIVSASLFVSLTAIVSIIATILVSQVIGDYANYQSNPYYLLSSISELSIFTRLKSVHTAVFVFLFALKLSLIAISADNALKRVFKKCKGKNLATYFYIGISIILSLLVCSFNTVLDFSNMLLENIYVLIAFVVVLPIICILISRKRSE